jgi:hypothetical protein
MATTTLMLMIAPPIDRVNQSYQPTIMLVVFYGEEKKKLQAMCSRERLQFALATLVTLL